MTRLPPTSYKDYAKPDKGKNWQQSNPHWTHWHDNRIYHPWTAYYSPVVINGGSGWWGDPDLSCDEVAELACMNNTVDYTKCFSNVVRLCIGSKEPLPTQ